MTLALYWWDPTRSLRSMQWEVRTNLIPWARVASRGGKAFRNFGDALSPVIVEAISGRQVRWCPIQDAEMIAVGSIIDLKQKFKSVALVWGSGLRVPNVDLGCHVTGDYLAVRGRLTASALGLDSTLPLGDPGILSGRILGRAKRGTTIAMVPHFLDFNSRDNLREIRAAERAGIRIIPPTLPPKIVVRELSKASLVLTSSLHGYICAHSVGTAAALVSFGSSLEPRFKYDDYLSLYRGAKSKFWSVGSAVTGISTVRREAEETLALVSKEQEIYADRLSGALTATLS